MIEFKLKKDDDTVVLEHTFDARSLFSWQGHVVDEKGYVLRRLQIAADIETIDDVDPVDDEDYRELAK